DARQRRAGYSRKSAYGANMQPVCWVIAGPNGSGKTTFARDFLPDVAGVSNFINADLIAAGLSPFAPEKQLPATAKWLVCGVGLPCFAQRRAILSACC